MGALGLVLGCAALAMYAFGIDDPNTYETAVHLPWVALAVGFLIADIAVVHLHFGSEAHSFSMSELALVFGLFFATPQQLVTAQLIGAGIALVVYRRQRRVKLAFNLAQFALSTTVAITIFQSLHGAAPVGGGLSWMAALLAALAASALSVAAIAVAIWLHEGSFQRGKLFEALWLALLASLASAALALLGVNAVLNDPAAAWLLVPGAAAFFLTYRAYVAQRQRNGDLRLLYECSRILAESSDIDQGLVRLLSHVRATLRAEVAETVVAPHVADERPVATQLRGAQLEATTTITRVEADDPLLALARRGRAVVLDRRRPLDLAASALMASRNLDDAVVVPLRAEQRISGVMVLANRLGEGKRFDNHDLVVLEALARHVGVVLDKGDLQESLAEVNATKDRLSHAALHDPLTGLANRTLFHERLEQALASRRGQDASTAVLFLDLDGFKTVNDTLGHAVGDELLIGVAKAMQACLRPADLAARLGGDEFGVLLVDGNASGEPAVVGRRILDALAEGVSVSGGRLPVAASVGAAVAAPGDRGADVVARADEAMYRAKSEGKHRLVSAAPRNPAAGRRRG